MHLFTAIVIVWILCRCGDLACRAEQRRLRAVQRLLAQYPPEPSYDSPSPHQLLGEIARPTSGAVRAGCLAKA